MTSREALGVEGELTYRVPSLRLPDARHALPVAQLGEYDAIRLFADRAALSQPGFALTEGNASAIGQICQRLDGMPLAIEFAAARVRMLSIEQIAARLDDLFRLLTAGTRRVLPRQQTLRATMDWSYDLLMEHERTLFRRLSVFAGGFTMEAAENIGAGNGVGKRDILDLLTRLVDKSLVVFDERNGQARYRLPESVRQYGRERLQESGEANDVQRRHRDWHLDLAERAESQSRGHDQDAWLDRLETEHDNMRAALAWSKSAEEGVEAWLRLAGALSWFWYANGHWSEGRRWLEDALSHGEAPEPSILFEVVREAWTLAYAQADFERMRELREKFMALSERLDNKESSIIARVCMGLQAVELGEPERAIMLLEESVTLARAFGDKWVLALALGQLSYGLNILGNHEDALRLIEESVHLLEDFGDKWRLSVALRNWGTVLLHQHDYDRAATCYADSIRLRDPAKNMWVVFQSLEGLACVASARRQYKRAAVLFGAAKPIQESLLSRRDRDHQIEVEQYAKATRTSLGEEAFVSASTEGRAMTLDQAVQFALAFSGAEKSTGQRLPAKRRDGDLLTVRESDVVRLVARGLTNRAIAATLVVSGRTVDAHVQNILNKLGFSSRAQIAAWAVERGLTGEPEAGTAMPDVRPSQPGRAT